MTASSSENGLRRRCSFDRCGRPATAQGNWPAIDVTGWYCRIHLNMLKRVSGVREVVGSATTAALSGSYQAPPEGKT